MHDFELSIDPISKVEGSAALDIKVVKGEVDLKFRVNESKRFFTQALKGMDFKGMPQLVSRICGVCSTAHLLASMHSVENALNVTPSEQTVKLRKLTTYGANIRDHALHLYMFVLPDYFRKDSVLDFETEEERKLLHECFHVKAAGNALVTGVAGKAVHAPFPQINGFLKTPKNEDLKQTVAKLDDIRSDVLTLIDLFYKWDVKFVRPTKYVALKNNDCAYVGGDIACSDGEIIEKKDFFHHFNRVVIPYSEATSFVHEKNSYVVGAVARLNINKDHLHKDTKKDASKALSRFPSSNVYDNNLAQAIEILHCIDASKEMIESTDFKEEKIPPLKLKECEGVGVAEAPRGLLYYLVTLNKAGKIRKANLAIPSGQNLVQMQKDLKLYIEKNLDKDKKELERDIEMLIRAYDPCMSCATHFIKFKWEGI